MAADPSPATPGDGPSRRTFLTGAALTGVALGAGSWAGESAAAAAAPEAPSAAGLTASCGLELDGAVAGGLQSVSGGAIVGTIVEHIVKDVRRKHISKVTMETVTMTAGTGMSKAFYQDVAAMVGGGRVQRDCRFTTRDGSGAVIGVRRFRGAVLTEVTFPELDASAEEAALMTLQFSHGLPYIKTSAGPKQPTPSTSSWQLNHYRLRIKGVDCSQVSRIGRILIREPIIEPPLGSTRELTQYGPTEYSNLEITMPQSAAGSLYTWSNSFLAKLKSDERTGQLDFLSIDDRVLFTLKMSGLGLFKIEPAAMSADADPLPVVTASIYCEQMTFSHTAAAVGAAAAGS